MTEETNIADADDELSLDEFTKERAGNFARLAVLLIFDAMLIVLWFGIDRLVHLLGNYIDGQGAHERCAFLLKELAPWGIFAIAILHIVKDVVVEIKKLWKAVLD